MPQQSGGGGFLSGMMGAVAQGAALGTGSAIAHRAMDSVMGPRTVVHDHQGGAPPAGAPMESAAPQGSGTEGPCGGVAKLFADCIQRSGGDMGACQVYMDAMNQCRMQNPSFA